MVYLVLMTMLAHALTAQTRSLLPALIGMLSLISLSPLLAGFTEHVRWLPDRAGSLLHPTDRDTVLPPFAGGRVLLTWALAVAAVATRGFLRRNG